MSEWKSINEFKARKWHSILLGEDRLVAALQKSLLREHVQIPLPVAYQGVRDVLGELYTLLVAREKEDIALEIDAVVARNDDGSEGGGDAKKPDPNP